jgi:flagellar biosynthesis GTPase FlhF
MKYRNSKSMLKKVIERKVFNNDFLNNKIINNKITLFIVSALAFFSLYIHITSSHFTAVLLFFLTAGLVYTFTNNMTVVLGMSFIVTTFASIFKDIFGFKEGLKNEKEKAKEKVKEGLNEEDTEKEETEEGETEETEKKDSDTKKKKKPSEATKKDKLDKFGNQKLNPALYNTPSKQNMEKQLGKASEMEQAYDNLEKVMGTENVNSISSDTKDLIKQQNELIKQLKTMTPALNDAMASLGGLDLNKLTGMFNSATKNLSEIKGTE